MILAVYEYLGYRRSPESSSAVEAARIVMKMILRGLALTFQYGQPPFSGSGLSLGALFTSSCLTPSLFCDYIVRNVLNKIGIRTIRVTLQRLHSHPFQLTSISELLFSVD
jgi:hypothetical protein